MSDNQIEDEVLLLNSEKSKSSRKYNNDSIIKKIIITISAAIGIFFICFIAQILGEKYGSFLMNNKNNKIDNNNNNNNYNSNNNTLYNDLPDGFVFVNEKSLKGPITIDRQKDDGTKLDLYSFINKESDDFYYNQDEFDALDDIIPDKSAYLCELGTGFAPEAYKGYNISCPAHYTINIDKVFYGRHANDKKHCNVYYEGVPVEDEMLDVKKECGNEPIENVKEICEGRVYCTLRPGGSHFTDSCPSKFKYLHINYHCEKDEELKKERFTIVMFSNNIKPNSIYENAVSSFYQYAQIHNYEFQFNHYRYDTERQVFFMKLNSVLEKVIIGLKEKKYDWVFWVDSDVILANPNIKLEAFLPNENMNNIHLIIADDVNGLNAGVFLMRVHPWSLNLLMRAMSYSYFNDKKGLKYADQSSINNVLFESEENNYIVVPQNWFNSYIGLNKDGDFLLHLAGHVTKDSEAETFRNHIKSDKKWYSKTSKEMREEVLKYYSLPEKEQHHIKFE